MRFFKVLFNFIFNKDHRRCFRSLCRALRYTIFKQDYPRAIEEYKSILDNGVHGLSESKTYRELGEVYFYNNNYAESETVLRKALQLKMKTKSHDALLYKLLGQICGQNGKYEESLMFYEKAVQFGSKGFINKMLVNMDYVLKQKAFLDEYKPLLPFMTAYFQQNKHKFESIKHNGSD